MDNNNCDKKVFNKKSKVQELHLNSLNKEDLLTKYNELKKQEQIIDREIEELVKRGITTDLKPQMEALHQYNQAKDITQHVLGYLADINQTTVANLHQQFNLPVDD